MTRAELEQHADRGIKLDQLLKHPGWAIFQKQIKEIADVYYSQAVKASDPHTMATRLGAYAAVQAAVEWPAEEIDRVREALAHPEEYLDEPSPESLQDT